MEVTAYFVPVLYPHLVLARWSLARNGRADHVDGHPGRDRTRCLLVQREGLHPFNASDISWLERRLVDVCWKRLRSIWPTRPRRRLSLCRTTRPRSSSAQSSLRLASLACSALTSSSGVSPRVAATVSRTEPLRSVSETGPGDACNQRATSARYRAGAAYSSGGRPVLLARARS